jgi:predicted DsbA family dithiol-disulfide isomerase
MVRSKKTRARKVHVYHATAPTCWWSWGYEAVMNRLPLVYGSQVEIHLRYGTVYEDFNDYLKAYELTFDSLNGWARESIDTMGVPIRANYSAGEPKSVLLATYAVLAALRQGRPKGGRFNRAILRRFVVEGQDVTQAEVLDEAAKEAGLNVTRFRKDFADTPSREAELGHQAHSFAHLPLGFYNVAITDGGDRAVILDYSFEPSVVEEAIDYLSAGSLTKRVPRDVVGYLREHGPSPMRELARVFGDTPVEMKRSLAALERRGKVTRTTLCGAPHWHSEA